MPDNSKPIADVQSQHDERQLPINKVGIRDIKHPVVFVSKSGEQQQTTGIFSMYVNLPHDQKGTHMSRFVELLNQDRILLSANNFSSLLTTMTDKLDAEHGYIETTFDVFIEKSAPVSGAKSLMDYTISYVGETKNDIAEAHVKILVPVTSLCPCSKKVADYGAHNQRSHITVTVPLQSDLACEDIIKMVESESSSELYGILKRTDEKYITEHAYDNPKFVEDLIRDIAHQLKQTFALEKFRVEAENFESIHNHSAYAVIDQL